MGYDLYGTRPTSGQGRHFRRGMADWYPLADLCQTLAPEESSGCAAWLTNDGNGLDVTDALRLADRLEKLLADGGIATYCRARLMHIEQLPADSPDRYGAIGEDDVREFVSFLRESGGFEIL